MPGSPSSSMRPLLADDQSSMAESGRTRQSDNIANLIDGDERIALRRSQENDEATVNYGKVVNMLNAIIATYNSDQAKVDLTRWRDGLLERLKASTNDPEFNWYTEANAIKSSRRLVTLKR